MSIDLGSMEIPEEHRVFKRHGTHDIQCSVLFFQTTSGNVVNLTNAQKSEPLVTVCIHVKGFSCQYVTSVSLCLATVEHTKCPAAGPFRESMMSLCAAGTRLFEQISCLQKARGPLLVVKEDLKKKKNTRCIACSKL